MITWLITWLITWSMIWLIIWLVIWLIIDWLFWLIIWHQILNTWFKSCCLSDSCTYFLMIIWLIIWLIIHWLFHAYFKLFVIIWFDLFEIFLMNFFMIILKLIIWWLFVFNYSWLFDDYLISTPAAGSSASFISKTRRRFLADLTAPGSRLLRRRSSESACTNPAHRKKTRSALWRGVPQTLVAERLAECCLPRCCQLFPDGCMHYAQAHGVQKMTATRPGSWDAVKLTLPGSWLHLSFRGHRPYRFRSDDCSCSRTNAWQFPTYPRRRIPAFLPFSLKAGRVCDSNIIIRLEK